MVQRSLATASRGADAARAVRLEAGSPSNSEELDNLASRARSAAANINDSLAFAAHQGGRLPIPGTGSTLDLWERLATVAAADLTVARVLEPHADALAILAQAGGVALEQLGLDTDDAITGNSTWGVFAAEAKDVSLSASPSPYAANPSASHLQTSTATSATPGTAGAESNSWSLTGTKPWCSLGSYLSHAVVTARTDGGRRAFAVDLRHAGVSPEPVDWAPHGLAKVNSGPLLFDAVPAVPVGADNWYLQRPGFAWGGMGVAAVWYGGAVGLGRRLWKSTSQRTPDQVALLQLGAVDSVLNTARSILAEAARMVDAGEANGAEGAVLAHRVRAGVAAAAEEVLTRVGHALGPAPLALEREHADRVADLQLYLRQHHAERDLAGLGSALLKAGGRPW